MVVKQDETLAEERKILYTYWDDLPIIKLIEQENKLYHNHECRPAINRLIKEGVEDSLGRQLNKRRRALNVDEIQQLLDVSKGIKVSKTNLYFHLNYLEEAGYITVITTLREKRHNVKYYGRTARVHLTSDDLSNPEETVSEFEEFGVFLKILNPGIDLSNLKKYAEEYFQIQRDGVEEMMSFVEHYENILASDQISIWKISGLINKLKGSRPVLVDFWERFFKEFEFNYP